MDEKETKQPNAGEVGSRPSGPRSDDPREELRMQLQLMGQAAGDLIEQLVKVPATLAQIPLQVLPEETATHARNAATEGFAAVRTLLDSISKGVDEVLKAQRERMSSMGSTRTGVGGVHDQAASAPVQESGTRELGAGGASYTGGHGSGAGPTGTGTNGADDSSRTTRLES